MKNELGKIIFKLNRVMMENIEKDLYVLVNADINCIEIIENRTCELIEKIIL